ncbi:hypothetical protein ACFOY4_04955 [Actinomadura syzygii]|uniref:Uncharacterized protein n=1 Tax=Actinomadura syzygii TaxID=1427538 RepID=A0A5D0TXE3_9ACTN|nr:hypothetical protein [Actinomadura syzygii]TYC10036.1 hypothetical protein FXF65_33625 [Actinomadura syzygii]
MNRQLIPDARPRRRRSRRMLRSHPHAAISGATSRTITIAGLGWVAVISWLADNTADRHVNTHIATPSTPGPYPSPIDRRARRADCTTMISMNANVPARSNGDSAIPPNVSHIPSADTAVAIAAAAKSPRLARTFGREASGGLRWRAPAQVRAAATAAPPVAATA